MLTQGYYRRPAIHGDAVYFVTEDDVWCVLASGGLARRLTAGLGLMGNMAVSPDGQWLAITAREEKHSEVYITLAEGGPLKRLTYLGAECSVRGFTREGEILFTSNAAQPFQRLFVLYRIGRDGGQPQQYPWGAVQDLSFGPQGRKVLGRSTADPAYWKRYRGGLAGKLWIDNDGNGQFRPLLPDLNGNLASPMWIGNRIFFLSDHEGVGNLYSCDTDGVNLRRHTDHEEYFARSANTDGIASCITAEPTSIVLSRPADASARWRSSGMAPQHKHNGVSSIQSSSLTTSVFILTGIRSPSTAAGNRSPSASGRMPSNSMEFSMGSGTAFHNG